MANKITLKTSFDFDAAHRLVGYPGKCLQLHGHIWHVDIEVEGERYQLDSNGILWDFSNVKALKDLLDHRTILKDCIENKEIIDTLIIICGNDSVYIMDENPTAENLCYEILTHLKKSNPDLIYKITVWESPKSYAEIKE